MAARFTGAGMVGWEEVGNHRGKLCGVSFWEREGMSKHMDGKSGYLPLQKRAEQTASPVPGRVVRRYLPRTQDFGP